MCATCSQWTARLPRGAPPAAPRRSGCANSSTPSGSGCTSTPLGPETATRAATRTGADRLRTRAAAVVLRPARPGGGTRPARRRRRALICRVGRRVGGRRGTAVGGRGLRRRPRPGITRLPRPDRAQRRHVRPGRSRLRLLHLRHALLHEPRDRPARAGVRRPAACGRGRRRDECRTGATAAVLGPGPGAWTRSAHSGARRRSRARRHRRDEQPVGAARPARVPGRRRVGALGAARRCQHRPRGALALLDRRRPRRVDVPPARPQKAPDLSLQTDPGWWVGRWTCWVVGVGVWRTYPVESCGRMRPVSGGDILDELSWRNLVAQSTDADALRAELATGPVTLYAGFDPTAASLHAGHLVQVLTLRRFQQAGHRPIVLAGGATGMVGDPREVGERVMYDVATVTEWTEKIRGQLARFVDFGEGPTSAIAANNLDWTAPMSAIEFLRDVGKHFSVNVMLARETVKSRLAGEGISYTEFSYLLLQSLDYLELFRRHGCRLQIGGSDQWGNILGGVDLVRRVESAAVHALTTPLVTNATGEKFGKSTGGGRLWLDPALTSPYAFYQYWVNVDDRDVGDYLRYFTFLSREEIEALDAETVERPQARAAQRALARDLTTLVHGAAETERVEAASRALFGQGELAEL